MDKYLIDSHKLYYHVSRLNDWFNGRLIYPIYMEISPSGACNHRCSYCGLDFMEYRAQFLREEVLKNRLSEMGKLGVKGIMYGGEGEPFLHKYMTDIICQTKLSGIDVAMTTNGVLLTEDKAEKILSSMEWIKVSLNAGKKNTYAEIHGTKSEDFDRVMDNLKRAVNVRNNKKYSVTIGIQIILLPENENEITLLAKIGKEIGVDYLVVKPYSQHPQSKTTKYSQIKYKDYKYLEDELKAENTEHFSVIFRSNAMTSWDDAQKCYKKCLALPFWSYIDSYGNVWGCSVYLKDNNFYYGNINDSSFQEIWEGERRLKSLKWAQETLDVSKCRINCRMDSINQYLWKLKNPPKHVNFI